MTNTIVGIQHADLGMPASARFWLTSLRALPMTGSTFAAADQMCANGDDYSVTGQSSVFADAVVIKGAFAPGTSTWSPPI